MLLWPVTLTGENSEQCPVDLFEVSHEYAVTNKISKKYCKPCHQNLTYCFIARSNPAVCEKCFSKFSNTTILPSLIVNEISVLYKKYLIVSLNVCVYLSTVVAF
jgi:hypothetical protein